MLNHGMHVDSYFPIELKPHFSLGALYSPNSLFLLRPTVNNTMIIPRNIVPPPLSFTENMFTDFFNLWTSPNPFTSRSIWIEII